MADVAARYASAATFGTNTIAGVDATSDQVLVVSIPIQSGTVNVTNVTLGGAGGFSQIVNHKPSTYGVEIWAGTGFTASGATLEVTYSGTVRNALGLTVYNNADLPLVAEAQPGGGDASTNVTLTFPTVTADDYMQDALIRDDSSLSPTPGANQTDILNLANGGRRLRATDKDGGFGNTMEWTSGTADYAVAGVRIPNAGGAPPVDGDPEDLTQAQSLTDPSGQRNTAADPDDIGQSQALSEPTGQRNTSADPQGLTQSQVVTEPTGTSTGAQTGDPEDLGQSQSLTEPLGQRNTSADPQGLTQAQTVSEPAGSTATIGTTEDVSQAQTIGEPTASVLPRGIPENVAQLQSLTAPSANRQTTATVASLTQAQPLSTPAAFVPATARGFPLKVADMQRKVVEKLGEPMTTPHGVFDGVFENEWYDPALGPIGFEGAQTYVEFLGADVELVRGEEVTRQLDGETYRVKEVRREEFYFIRYILEAA